MFPDYNKEIRVKAQAEQLTVPEVIGLLDRLGKELSRDQMTEQYAQYINYVSEQLQELRQKALEVAMEAEEEKIQMLSRPVKKPLPN